MEHAKGRLAQGFGDGELIHLFVIALLQVDDFALAGAADQDHREAVGGGVGQRSQSIQEARRRHGQADAGLLGQEARDRSGVACVLLVTEGYDPHAFGLRHTRQIRDGNAGQTEDGVDSVEFQGIDNQMKSVGHFHGIFSRRRCRLCAWVLHDFPRFVEFS